MMMTCRQLTRAYAMCFALTLSLVMAPQAQARDDFDALTSEQAAYATRFSEFLERMDTYYFDLWAK